jgi:hypothetical protein
MYSHSTLRTHSEERWCVAAQRQSIERAAGEVQKGVSRRPGGDDNTAIDDVVQNRDTGVGLDVNGQSLIVQGKSRCSELSRHVYALLPRPLCIRALTIATTKGDEPAPAPPLVKRSSFDGQITPIASTEPT